MTNPSPPSRCVDMCPKMRGGHKTAFWNAVFGHSAAKPFALRHTFPSLWPNPLFWPYEEAIIIFSSVFRGCAISRSDHVSQDKGADSPHQGNVLMCRRLHIYLFTRKHHTLICHTFWHSFTTFCGHNTPLSEDLAQTTYAHNFLWP